jgi:chemotaxis protein MotB
VSGGGDGVFNGDSVFTDMTLVQNGTGASAPDPGQTRRPRGADGDTGSGSNIAPEDKSAFEQVEEALRAFSGESMVSEDLLRHVVTRLTDEGLVIEVFSLPGAPLFEPGSDRPTRLLTDLARMIADVADITVNPVAIGAHMPANPVVLVQNPVWAQSGARADLMRGLMLGAGFDGARVRRLVGHGDRQQVTPDPMALRNERIEVILLRRGL